MAHKDDLYEVTDLHNYVDISGIVQNEVGSFNENSNPNVQQNYENIDFEKIGGEQNTATEHEYFDSYYANISDTRTPDTSSNDLSSSDASQSLDEQHGKTNIIIKHGNFVLNFH